jgi:hypothetical protein
MSALLLSACSGAILTTKDPSQRVLLYGYLDMSQSGKAAKYLIVKSNQPIPTAMGGRFDLYDFPEDGYFAVRDLLPGYTYNISGLKSSVATYGFGENPPKKYKMKPGPADMVFVGAYRYVPEKRTWGDVLNRTGSFSLERAKVTEVQVLRRLRKTIGDAHWERRIDERITQLVGRR